MEKHTNVFDPIQSNLDQDVFKGIDLRDTVTRFIQKIYYNALDHKLGVEGKEWADLYLTGSLTTYQYNETSDADCSVFPDYNKIWKELDIDPDSCRKMLVAMSINYLDGTFIPGTEHPLQFFVMPPGSMPSDRFKPGLRSGYDVLHHTWFVKPEKSRVHNVQEEWPDVYQRAADIADKMTEMLDSGNIDAAKELWVTVHEKRSLDQQNGLGDFSEGNIVLKGLLHEGLVDRLRNEAHMKIETKTSMAERSGDPELDQLIEEFMRGNIQLQRAGFPNIPVVDLSDPQIANYQCSHITNQLVEFLEEHGIDAISSEEDSPHNPMNYDYQGTDDFGYKDRVIPGSSTHAAAIVTMKTGIYMVDFTAAQYGYKEFPMVQKLDGGNWQRQWETKTTALPHLWDDRVTTKVIWDWDHDRIVLGTMATIPDLPNSKIVGEYKDGNVTLYEAEKQWISPVYFRRLWHSSYPDRELKDVYFRRGSGDEYKLRSLPRKRNETTRS